MANVFQSVIAPAGNGAGAAVDFSTFGGEKTIIVSGTWTLPPTINIEFNNATSSGDGSWAPLATFQGRGIAVKTIACKWIRARVSNFRGGQAPVVNIAGTDDGTDLVELTVPPGNGAGAAVDISALGSLKTLQIGGAFSGAINVEVSADGATEWATAFSSMAQGSHNAELVANWARVVRSGVTSIGGTPVVALGGTTGEGGNSGMSADERAFWQLQAALLDPLAYVLESTDVGGLDVTVPNDEVWYATNAFAVNYNDPTYFSQNPVPGLERAGFLRPLDSRRSMIIPSGTRVRSVTGINVAYLYYCNPSLVVGTDVRYTTDPKGLYYERLRRLGTFTVRELICEASGGGSIDDVVAVDIPNDFDNGMLIGVSIYDCCWLTWGLLNVTSEINNTHLNRRGESVLQPFQRLGIGGTQMTLKKGTLSDGWSLNPYGDPYSSIDPATAYPFNGTANALYVVLPADW